MLNRFECIGNLGSAPGMKDANGTAIASFSLATSSKWTDKSGQRQERTEWHRIEAFGKLAEICGKYLQKGSKVYVAGELRYDKWESKEGTKMTTAKIVLSGPNAVMEMLDGKPSGDREEPAGTRGADARREAAIDFTEDVPF